MTVDGERRQMAMHRRRKHLPASLAKLLALFRRPASKKRPRSRWVSGIAAAADGRLDTRPAVPPQRRFLLFTPPNFTLREHLPLVVMLHGCTQSAKEFAAGTRFNELARRHRFLVLYPEQNRTANPVRCWNWFDPACQRGRGEVAIVMAMVEKIARLYPVDANRIYVAGLSAGGALAGLLARFHGATFAAAAIHSGLAPGAADSMFAAARAMRGAAPLVVDAQVFAVTAASGESPPPVMVIHGDADRVVVARNGAQIVGFMLGAHAAPSGEGDEPGELPSHRSQSREVAASASAREHVVTDHYIDERLVIRDVRIRGLGHAWSGGDERHAYHDARGPKATNMIWGFFAALVRPAR